MKIKVIIIEKGMGPEEFKNIIFKYWGENPEIPETNYLHPQDLVDYIENIIKNYKGNSNLIIPCCNPYTLQSLRYFNSKYKTESFCEYYKITNKVPININGNFNSVFTEFANVLGKIMNVDSIRYEK